MRAARRTGTVRPTKEETKFRLGHYPAFDAEAWAQAVCQEAVEHWIHNVPEIC